MPSSTPGEGPSPLQSHREWARSLERRHRAGRVWGHRGLEGPALWLPSQGRATIPELGPAAPTNEEQEQISGKRHLKGCCGRNYSRRDFSPLSAASEPGAGAMGMQFLCWSLLPFCSSKPAPGRNFCFILSGISEASEFWLLEEFLTARRVPRLYIVTLLI